MNPEEAEIKRNVAARTFAAEWLANREGDSDVWSYTAHEMALLADGEWLEITAQIRRPVYVRDLVDMARMAEVVPV